MAVMTHAQSLSGFLTDDADTPTLAVIGRRQEPARARKTVVDVRVAVRGASDLRNGRSAGVADLVVDGYQRSDVPHAIDTRGDQREVPGR